MGLMSLMVPAGFVFLRSPLGFICVGYAVTALWFIQVVICAFSYVKLEQDSIAIRYLFLRKYPTSEIQKWSQAGKGGNIFLQTLEGRTFGFSRWCVHGDRMTTLRKFLELKIGPESIGNASVRPWYLSWID